jgi:gluconokinase
MAQNKPLTDADRWDWLVLLRKPPSPASPPTTRPDRRRRHLLRAQAQIPRRHRIASYNDHDVHVHFIYLRVADEETLLQRVKARQGHYMKS